MKIELNIIKENAVACIFDLLGCDLSNEQEETLVGVIKGYIDDAYAFGKREQCGVTGERVNDWYFDERD